MILVGNIYNTRDSYPCTYHFVFHVICKIFWIMACFSHFTLCLLYVPVCLEYILSGTYNIVENIAVILHPYIDHNLWS